MTPGTVPTPPMRDVPPTTQAAMAARGHAACMAGWPMFDLAQQDQAGDRGKGTPQRVGADDHAIHRDAGQTAGFLVATGRVHVVAETREPEQHPHHHRHRGVDDTWRPAPDRSSPAR